VAVKTTSAGIATPLSNLFVGNRFRLNTSDILTSQSYSVIKGNHFMSAGAGATNKVVSTVTLGAATGNNHVVLNYFTNGNADIDPDHGNK